jgi:hypothetical protein
VYLFEVLEKGGVYKELKIETMRALGRLGDPQSIQPLIVVWHKSQYRSEEYNVAYEVIKGFKDPDALLILLKGTYETKEIKLLLNELLSLNLSYAQLGTILDFISDTVCRSPEYPDSLTGIQLLQIYFDGLGRIEDCRVVKPLLCIAGKIPRGGEPAPIKENAYNMLSDLALNNGQELDELLRNYLDGKKYEIQITAARILFKLSENTQHPFAAKLKEATNKNKTDLRIGVAASYSPGMITVLGDDKQPVQISRLSNWQKHLEDILIQEGYKTSTSDVADIKLKFDYSERTEEEMWGERVTPVSLTRIYPEGIVSSFGFSIELRGKKIFDFRTPRGYEMGPLVTKSVCKLIAENLSLCLAAFELLEKGCE